MQEKTLVRQLIPPLLALAALALAGMAWVALETRLELWQRLVLAGGLVAVAATGIAFRIGHRLGATFQGFSAQARAVAGGQSLPSLPLPDFQEGRGFALDFKTLTQQNQEQVQALLRRQNELEAVLASMAEGVVAVNGEERVVDINPSAARFFGLHQETTRGRYLVEVVRVPELLRFVTATLKAEIPQEEEIQVPRGGEAMILQAWGTPLRNSAGKKIGGLLVLHNVTQVRRLENLRRDFVANVSHELKTPITAIKGFVETLREGALKEPAEAERFLGIIARQVERLQTIIEELLELSRLEQESETGGIPLARGAIQPVLESALQVCRGKAEERGVPVRIHCPEPLFAAINAPLLEHALANLIDNAIKYGGGEILVEAMAESGGVAIRVSDQGPGIPKTHQARLFERFYRVDRARSRSEGGTGLGLAIVKHISQAHGGSVEVVSKPGDGAVFCLRLPGQSPPKTAASK